MATSPLRDADEYAIRVENVSKSYPLWSSPNARLQYALMSGINRVLPSSSGLSRRLTARKGRMYHDFKALDGVSLDIRKGESWGVIGVNGSGKSTLLKIISGNLLPSTGRVEVDGKVARLDYSSGLNPDFTGRENVFLKAAVMGMTRRETEAKYDSIVDFAEIGEFVDQPVRTYSSGMQARLGFAIVAHIKTDILISDEALAVGDAFFVQKCMDYIRSFLKNGTFLFVTHSTSDVVALCEKAVWLEHGRIREIGTAKDVADAYLSSQALQNSERFLATSGTVRRPAKSRTTDDSAAEERLAFTAADTREIAQPALARFADAHPTRPVKDGRLDILNASPQRNDIEIPPMSMEGGFGVGGARIDHVSLENLDEETLTWIVGGEMARLRIGAVAERDLNSPIVGFQVRDRLGQTLFADNTYLVTVDRPLAVLDGQRLEATFEFQMPLLPIGEYAVRVAVADGSEKDGAMLNCLPTALSFRSQTSGSRHGLVGVPMERVTISLSAAKVTPGVLTDSAV